MTKLSKLIELADSFGNLVIPRVNELAKIRSLAIRGGIWRKVLSRIERGLVDLTLKVTNMIRSRILAEAVHSIVRKLREALENKVRLLQVGCVLAEKLSLIAQKWGNNSAKNWLCDKSFARFLGVMYMNNPEIFELS